MERKATSGPDPTTVRRNLGFMDAPQAAALLGISIASLRNRISAGTAPPSYKVGNDHLFDIAEVKGWIRRRRRGNAAR